MSSEKKPDKEDYPDLGNRNAGSSARILLLLLFAAAVVVGVLAILNFLGIDVSGITL